MKMMVTLDFQIYTVTPPETVIIPPVQVVIAIYYKYIFKV